jgi:hypothetical protein
MDYSVLYIIVILIGIVGVAFGVAYLRKNNYVSKEDLLFASEILGLTSAIIMELNLKNEPELKKITSIVYSSLNHAIALYDGNTDELFKESISFAEDLCEEFNIQLNENRKMIIEKLVQIAYQNKFMK